MNAPLTIQSMGLVAVLLYGLKYDGTVADWQVSATPKVSPLKSKVISLSPPGMSGDTPWEEESREKTTIKIVQFFDGEGTTVAGRYCGRDGPKISPYEP